MTKPRFLTLTGSLAVAFALSLPLLARSALAQQLYPSPAAGMEALVTALTNRDKPAYDVILGDDWREFIPTDEIDEEVVQRFLDAYAASHSIQMDADGYAYLAVGADQWVMPIPMLEQGDGWRFDVVAGADEMRTRRIGRNEIAAMQAALAYCDAQREYALTDRDGNGVLEYARRLVSTPGSQDGLYWAALPGEPDSPLGPLFAEDDPGVGFHGYRFRILEAQGPHASGGAYDYVIGDRMRAGFALLAWPVVYAETGVMSFMVNHDGELYERNRGPETETAAGTISSFDPDQGWMKTSP